MKKSALILSMLVVVSSAVPVIAMNNERQQSQQSRATQAINNILRLDLINNAFGKFGRGIGYIRQWFNGINTLVGDNKKNKQNNSIPNVFNNMAEEVQDGLRNANIPGLEEVVNDDRMGLIKVFCTGVVGYIFLKAIMNMNLFSAPEQPQTTNQ